jgi:RimJ/RimL family protein N-acetyltransferase
MVRETGFGSVYKDYSGLCEFKKMDEEIDEVCALYRIGVPECKGTNFDFLHHPNAMREVVGDGDTFMKRDWFIYVVEDLAAGKLCAGTAIRADRLNMTIWGEVGVIDPQYRQKGLFSDFLDYMNEIWSMTGAEYGLCWVATFHTISQKLMERHGWNVCGLFRGGYIMNHGGDNYYRHPVIMIEKFFNNGEKVTAKELNLTERSQAILDAIQSQGENKR